MLPKAQRMSSDDFKGLRGFLSFHSEHFLLRVKRSDEESRVSAVVSVKIVKTAPRRNLLRRRIYDALRGKFPLKGLFVSVIAKPESGSLSFAKLNQELGVLLKRALSG